MDLIKVYQAKGTVFTRSELAQLYPEQSERQMSNALHYAVKLGKLQRIRQGVYIKAQYDQQELACKLYAPAYVSLDTVLFAHGIIFQSSSEICCLSGVSREVLMGSVRIKYRKLNELLLTDPMGIISDGIKSVATLERAFVDTLLMDGDRYLDNLRPIDWRKVDRLLPIYQNKSLNRRVQKARKYAEK